jgi:hypothetical protein
VGKSPSHLCRKTRQRGEQIVQSLQVNQTKTNQEEFIIMTNQIFIYSISTDGFHSEAENKIHEELMRFHSYKNKLKEYTVDCRKRKKFISDHIKKLKDDLNKLFIEHEHVVRTLREDAIIDSNRISQFESTLTRTLGVKAKDTTTDIIIVRAYHYPVFKSLIENGFNYGGEHYQYFTSSAGMIRNKKSTFVRTEIATSKEFVDKIWCGMSESKINNTKFIDKEGHEEFGININKMNAYLALCMTSSVPFEGFNINKAIVVKDFKTVLKNQKVDYIDKNFNIEPNKTMPIEINHVDGAGMCLPRVSKKSFMFRMPHFKGLCIPFPFDEFIEDVVKKDDCTVTDLWGKEWNVIGDQIEWIFTESQFKLAKYYSSWDEYKDAFSKGCEFVVCNEENDADKFQDKPINYQVLQTLTDITTDEMRTLAAKTNRDIAKVGESKETMLRLLGIYNHENDKDSFQKALSVYPELLNDQHSKNVIRSVRDSLFKDAKAGKLLLNNSKRTFIAPDLFAFSEWLFMGIKEPKGLVNNGEVSCKLYPESTLDVLRAPHLFREHCLRKNIRNEKTNKWFVTNCIFMSTKSLDSKILMFDVDGDEAHLVSDPTFKFIAKRNMKDILPLEYELAVAKKEKVTKTAIYNALINAYSKNIGEVSNNISKIWNLPKNLIDMDTIRQLCYLNNAIIDFAKTLWIPTVPPDVKAKIKFLTSGKLPFFFTYAKNKRLDQVVQIPIIKNPHEEIEEMEKLSTVNKLEYIIKKKKLHFSKVENNFDYHFLMKKKKVVKTDSNIIDKYNELNRKKKGQLDKQLKLQGHTQSITELSVYDKIRRVLLEINSNEDDVVDMLVEYLYTKMPNSKKTTLWECFGEVLLRNLELNLQEAEKCEDCDTRFRQVRKDKKVCDDCKKKRDKKDATARKRKERQKQPCDKNLVV